MSKIDKIRVHNVDYDIGSLDTYSTDEQVVGTWVNGKPLYRKTILVAQSSTANTEIYAATNIDNIEKVVSLRGIAHLKLSNNTIDFEIPIPYSSNTAGQWTQIFYTYNLSAHQNSIGFNSGMNLNDIYATLEYTKSTD